VAALDHPHIIRMFEVGQIGEDSTELTSGMPYLVMEYARGGTLLSAMHTLDSWYSLRSVLLSILDALAHAHARGVVHRDLKPSNVLRCSDSKDEPVWKLSDFGLARIEGAASESGEGISGTFDYIAPEQLEGRWRDHGPWTDIYGLGCACWELATGRPPFSNRMGAALIRAHLAEPPGEFHPRFAVPVCVEAWIRRCLQKDAAIRFQRAADAAAALLELGQGEWMGAVPREQDDAPRNSTNSTLHSLVGTGAVPREQDDALRNSTMPTLHSLVGVVLATAWEAHVEAFPSTSVHGVPPLWGAQASPATWVEDRLWAALGGTWRDGPKLLVLRSSGTLAAPAKLVQWLMTRSHELGAATPLHIEYSERPAPEDGLRATLVRLLSVHGLPHNRLLKRTRQLVAAVGGGDAEALVAFLEGGAMEGSRDIATRWKPVSDLIGRMGRQRAVLIGGLDVHFGSEFLMFVEYFLRLNEAKGWPVLFVATVDASILRGRPAERGRLEVLLESPRAEVIDLRDP
jgi:hypothetical protein